MFRSLFVKYPLYFRHWREFWGRDGENKKINIPAAFIQLTVHVLVERAEKKIRL